MCKLKSIQRTLFQDVLKNEQNKKLENNTHAHAPEKESESEEREKKQDWKR